MRYSALALVSLWKQEQQPNESTFRYLNLCFKALKEVWPKNGITSIDLVYTAYTLLKCYSQLGNSTAVVWHLRGMHYFVQRLESNTSIPDWERKWIELLWLDGLADFVWRLRRVAIKDRQLLGAQLDEIHKALELRPLPTLVTPGSTWTHLVQLQSYLILYFAFYLALIDKSSPLVGSGTTNIGSVCEVVVRLVRQLKKALRLFDPQLHDVESYLQVNTSLEGLENVSLYYTYALIGQLVVCRETDMDDADLKATALVRYRISVKLVSVLRAERENMQWELWGGVIRNLFLTGLVLRKSSFPKGILNFCFVLMKTEHEWIAQQLRCYQDRFVQVKGSGVLLGPETEKILQLLLERLHRSGRDNRSVGPRIVIALV
jgi:hypothetical protein